MKILIVSESFPTSSRAELTGGVESSDYHLSTFLAKSHQVTVITNQRKNTPSSQNINRVRVIRVGIPTTPSHRQSSLVRFVFTISAFFQAFQGDFQVIIGSNTFTHPISFFAGKLKGQRAVAAVSDVYLGSWIKNTGILTGTIGEILERLNLRLNWDAIIAWSQTTQKKLIQNGINPTKVTAVHHGIDHALIDSIQAKKTPHPTITFAGRLVKYKHVDTLLHALPQIIAQYPQLHCHIIGDGPKKISLKKLAQRLHISDHVTFHGFISQYRQVLAHIKQSHLFCLPSTVEGFGLVTIEAAACGTPFVSTNIPATREITKQGRGGLLFQPQNANDLAVKALQLLSDKKLYQKKLKQALKLSKHYDWHQTAQKVQTVLEKTHAQ